MGVESCLKSSLRQISAKNVSSIFFLSLVALYFLWLLNNLTDRLGGFLWCIKKKKKKSIIGFSSLVKYSFIVVKTHLIPACG